MSVTFRRTAKGTTIRASGADAWRLLEALAGFAAEPQAQQGAVVAPEPVPNRSKSQARPTAQESAPGAAAAAGSEAP